MDTFIIFIEWVAQWLVTMRWSSSKSLIIPRVAMGMPPLRRKYHRPRTASPAAMTTIMDETPIGLHGIHAGRDMKIMQADQRSYYINTVVSA